MFVITDDAGHEDSAALHHGKVVLASAEHDDRGVDPLPLEQTVKRQNLAIGLQGTFRGEDA